MRRAALLCLLLLLLLSPALAQNSPAPQLAPHVATQLATRLDAHDLATLERLVAVAAAHDPALAAAEALARSEADLLERLGGALSVRIGGQLAGDLGLGPAGPPTSPAYGQAQGSYAVRVDLDVLALLPDGPARAAADARVAREQRRVRLATAEAFVRYRVAVEAAAASALALEGAEADYRVANARHEAGEAILADLLAARSQVGAAAVALLRANGEVVLALEALAAAVGIPPAAVVELLTGP